MEGVRRKGNKYSRRRAPCFLAFYPVTKILIENRIVTKTSVSVCVIPLGSESGGWEGGKETIRRRKTEREVSN